jgi:predicted metalloprotease
MSQFVSAVLGSTEVQWKEIFAQAGKRYEPPVLVMFSGSTRSGCGAAVSAMGPFYCPTDQKVYLDTDFFRELEQRFRGCEVGSKSCQFSQAYVITHEVGHHVQNLLGVLPKVQQMQQGLDKADANQLQVRVELQADCLAGVWAHHSEEKWRLIEPGDVEAAMQTASAIGDDRLQRRSQGYVVPDAFTHGSSEQRVRWFMNGLKSGQVASCDTFQAARL